MSEYLYYTVRKVWRISLYMWLMTLYWKALCTVQFNLICIEGNDLKISSHRAKQFRHQLNFLTVCSFSTSGGVVSRDTSHFTVLQGYFLHLKKKYFLIYSQIYTENLFLHTLQIFASSQFKSDKNIIICIFFMLGGRGMGVSKVWNISRTNMTRGEIFGGGF